MTDLETRLAVTLRSMASSVDGQAAPPIERVVGRADRLRRAQRVRVGGATLVCAAAVLGGLVLAWRDDSVPPIGGQDTTTTPTTIRSTSTPPSPSTSDGSTSGAAAGATTTTRPVSPTLPGGEPAFQPFGPADRIALLPERAGWTPVAYQSFGGEGNGTSEHYQAPSGDPAPYLVVTASPRDGFGGSSCEDRRAERGPDGTDSVFALRCLATHVVTIDASGLDRSLVDRLAATVVDEAPTRLDLTGTDLVSRGTASAQPPTAMISYTHPSWPGLQLTTTADGGIDSMAFLLASGVLRNKVEIDLDGVPAVQYTTAPAAADRAERTALSWRPAPGVFVTLLVEDVYDRLPEIARQVVLVPAAATHLELEARFTPALQVPGTTTTTTATDGAPLPGLAAIGLLPAGEGWSPIEYAVTPPLAGRGALYGGRVRADGTQSFVSVQVTTPEPPGSCIGGSGGVGEMRLGSEGMLVGSRCVGDQMVSVSARGLGRAVVERLLASVTAEAPTTLDTSGTDLVSLGAPTGWSGQVRVRYAHPDGGPGATVLTAVADPAVDELAITLVSYGPRDAEPVEVNGLPAVRYRSVVEGNVAWTSVVWEPRPGVLVTVMVSGESDRIVDIAASLQVEPAAAVHARLQSLPASVTAGP